MKHNHPPCNQSLLLIWKHLFFPSCSVGTFSQTSFIRTHIYKPFFLDSWGEREKVNKQDWFVTRVGPRKLGRTLGMSTKPSHGLARHWMRLSLRDNWLSIRHRDNKVSQQEGSKSLPVRRPWLHPVSSSFLYSLSLFLFYTWFTPKYPALSRSPHCFMLLSLMVFTVSMNSAILFLPATFPRSDLSIHHVRTTDWVVPVLKVSRCHELIVATHVLLCLKAK